MQDKAGKLVAQGTADARRNSGKYLLKIPVRREKMADVAHRLQPLRLIVEALLHLIKRPLQIVRITFHTGSEEWKCRGGNESRSRRERTQSHASSRAGMS